MKASKMTKKRFSKICRIYAGISRDRFKLIEYADGSTGVIELGVGMVENWSKQYLERVIIPLTTSGAGILGMIKEGLKMDVEAVAWAGEATAFSFEPFEVVQTPTGNGVFLAFATETKLTSMVEVKGKVLTMPTRDLEKIKN